MSTTAQQDDQSNQGTEDENKLPSSVHDLQIVTQDLQKSCDNRSNANVENKTSGNSVLIKEDPMHTDLDDYKIIEKSSMTPQNYQLNQVKEEENKLQIDNKAAGDCILSKNLTPTDFDVPKVNVVRYTDDNLVINPEHLAKSQSIEEIADSLTEKEEEILLNVDEENLMFANKFTKPVENANDKLITDIDKPINESVKTSNKNDDKASSSITSVDVDGYSSEILEEDMILKWDDNSEVEEPSSSDSNTDHKKNKEPSSSNQEQGHVDTIEQHEDICPTDTTNSSDKTKLGIQIIDNDQAVESSTLTVDNVIAKLEEIIEDDEALSIGNENTKEIESSIKDFETLPVHVELSDNQMNLDSSEVNIEECLTNIDKQIENIDHIEIKSKTVPVQTELNDNQMDLDAYEVNIEECLNNIDKQIEDIDQIEKKSKMIDKNITFDTSIVTETSASSNENNESINSLQINANSTILDHDISIGKNDSLEMNKNLRPLEIDGIETETNNDINTEISTSDIDSSLDVSIQLKEHNLNKPNMMIEIPSQELIDFVDDSDLSNNDNSMAENVEKGKNMEKSNKTLTEVTDNSNPPCNNVEKNNQDLTTTKMNLMKTSKREEVESEPDKVDKQSKEQRTKTHVREEVIKDISEQSTNLLSKDGVEDSEVTNTKHLTSTSALMAPDTSDEVPEVTDSLGLLAESSRVIEDDEEQETSEHDYGDDEEDFDPDDESSNQMTAEQSEDSNAQHSETDAPKDKPVTQANIQSDSDNAQDFTDKQVESSAEEKPEFTFALSDVVSLSVGKDADNKVAEAEKDGIIDIEDEIVCEEDDLAPETISDKELDNNQMEQTIKSTDTPVAPTVEDKNVNDEKKEQAGEIEIVKLSDTSDNEDGATAGKEEKENMLRYLLLKSTQTKKDHVLETERQSPSKSKNLETSEQNSFVNLVDLEESSSEDEVDQRKDDTSNKDPAVDVDRSTSTDVTSVNIPKEIEIMSSGENTSEIVTKEGEVVISGLPKPSPHKRVRLNTSEVSIKPAGAIESTIFIPETKINDDSQEKPKPKLSLEVFSLDSDDEDSIPVTSSTPMAPELEKTWINRCINDLCRSDNTIPHHVADRATVAFYDPNRKRKAMVCETCEDVVARRAQSLIDGIKNFTPLLEMDLGKICEDLVEISDSESDEDPDDAPVDKEALIGVEGAKVLEEKLADMINDTWVKYKMDLRLQATQDEVNSELDRMERESQEIDQMLDDCQIVTDRLRNELYATFETQVEELPPITICEMSEVITTRQSKRRLSSANETVAKRPAIPLGYTSLDAEPSPSVNTQQPKADPKPVVTADSSKLDDDKDISVVTTSAETVPADLPPPGEAMRPPLRVGMQVYAMRNAFGSWLRAKVVECTPKSTASPFSVCRVKFENKPNIKTAFKTLPGRSLAYHEPSEVRMNIGARIIALFKDSLNQTKRESYYSGVVAEPPSPLNGYRYLVFFDDGYAQYVQHRDTRLVCEFSSLVWEEVHPFSREFVRKYLTTFPERPMVKLHTGQSLKTEWNGKWWISKAMKVDASLVQVHFEEDNRTEWIYRGSTRLAPLYLELQAAERHRARPLPRNRVLNKVNMPYVEYTRDESSGKGPLPHPQQAVQTQAQAQEELRRQRAVAKKSTGAAPPPPAPAPAAPPAVPDTITSRVVYYTPKNSVKPYKMVNHTCGPKCKRSDVLALRDLRTYNPLAKPLLSGWERQVVRHKGHKEVMYRAPCGRRLRGLAELHRYLRATHSDMGVDLFDFGASTHCLAEFVLNRCIVSKKDLSHGKENVPVPCVNYYDEALPEFCSYNTERTPTEGVPLNLDPEFLCGCDCTDDCEDKSKCACWQMTLEGARTIGMGPNVGYSYKRLPEPLPSGIYECNSRCKCKHTCLNRVAQHPLQLKLQVFKTLNRGWGIRALNDVPKGSFLCVYAGNLLTDATANLDGLNEGDEYLAELDYIEVVEQMKEGYEEDIPQHDKKLDKKDSGNADEDDEESTTSEEDETPSKDETNDGDFEPGFIGFGITEFNKRLRKRAREKMEKDAANVEKNKDAGKENSDDCITISDDEEVREPSRFMAQAGIGANEFVSKYRSVRSHFGKDEACYIMDAKVQGNIGRYLNHSCSPNVFVQNVFVDTHDPRFPWVAFFALWHIKAGTELTWNYNYDIGSVPGKVLYCYCGAPNCRGRLL